ncbi:hypothetical protein T8K17_13360 [Thalassobaculum sp. OXR-137]|uniref:hypothetical protein n=1 Tax=Thalassobaculum sp. OXR-137 TaxID=3100173 RepID=UPI002AC8D10B|nr:hypothetical protein [Thalassobaculum sp. OXR-137]WPZ32230.1 hypothetical protein T8K17_13360 [Thalassobaculum sp. OXR-137]
MKFYTADYPDGIRAEHLSEAVSDTDLDLLKEIFFQFYEDPQNQLPYDKENEWGYLWIYGGPYYTSEAVDDLFGSYLPEETLDRLISELESVCAVWSPTPDDHPDGSESFDEEPTSTDDAREFVRSAAQQVRARVEALRNHPPGIGHNHPPEETEQTEAPLTNADLDEVSAAAGALEYAAADAPADASTASRALSVLRAASAKIRGYADKFIVAAVTAAGARFGLGEGELWIALKTSIDDLVSATSKWMELLNLPF